MTSAAFLTADLVRERLRAEMDPDTFAHAERSAEFAARLAGQHGVDPSRAELAALLHDVGDRFSERELLILADRYALDISLTEARVPKLLHGKVGAEVLRRDWGISDEELLDAVRDHIVGGVRMTTLAKIVFVADKLEPERDRYHAGLESIRQLAMVNLDAAMLKLWAWRLDQLVGAGEPVDGTLVAARNQLIERMVGRNH